MNYNLYLVDVKKTRPYSKFDLLMVDVKKTRTYSKKAIHLDAGDYHHII
jgi:hypothetical protein